jgi:hypothetical protein
MKATLIKKAEGWYNLYQDNIGIGSTHSELQGYKLCQKNCDEIFGIVDVEELAEQEVFQEYYDWGGEVFSEDYLISKRLHFIEGFNKAMELNKDKVFTVEDMHEALHLMNNTPPVPVVGEALEIVRKETEIRESIVDAILVSKQLREVEVQLLEDGEWYEKYQGDPPMHFKIQHNQRFDGDTPRLDENDCLILTKAKQ